MTTLRALLLTLLVSISACGQPAAQPARRELGPAAQRMRAAGMQGLVPPGDYACVLRDPDRPVQTDGYGQLSVRAAAFRLERPGAARQSGTLHATPAGQLIWNGPLGPIDAEPRHVSRARVSASEDVVSLIFDFAPALGAPRPATQAVCSLTVGADL
jgi:hypothetical protein